MSFCGPIFKGGGQYPGYMRFCFAFLLFLFCFVLFCFVFFLVRVYSVILKEWMGGKERVVRRDQWEEEEVK